MEFVVNVLGVCCRRAVLLHCLGPEGQRIYATLPPVGTTGSDVADAKPPDNAATPSYDETLARLEAHFQPCVNIVTERYRFRQRAQHEGESVDEYVSALRALAASCSFGSLTDEMIRYQLVEKTSTDRIRERLLLEPTLTLTSALTLSRQMEAALRESKSIAQGVRLPQSNSSVNARYARKSKSSAKTSARKSKP